MGAAVTPPRTPDNTEFMAAFAARLARLGIPQDGGPVDDTPTPDDPGHPEYTRRSRARYALARWTTATPPRYHDATCTHPQVTAWADAVATDPAAAGSLLMTGPIGTGKTHEAYGALRRIAEAGTLPRYGLIGCTVADLYGRLRPGSGDGNAEQLLRRLCEVPLLLLDDIGTAKASEWTEEVTFRLLNHRYNHQLPTILTTNHPLYVPPAERDAGVHQLSDHLSDRIISRLREMTTPVALTGTDRRRPMIPLPLRGTAAS